MIDLLDTSAWAVAYQDPELQLEVENHVLDLHVGTCVPVMLELLHGARNASEFADLRHRLEVLDRAPLTPDVETRALDVYESLAKRGGAQQRQVKLPDVLIAAAAEISGMRVVHYDADFDVIGEITGQPTIWIVPRGSA